MYIKCRQCTLNVGTRQCTCRQCTDLVSPVHVGRMSHTRVRWSHARVTTHATWRHSMGRHASWPVHAMWVHGMMGWHARVIVGWPSGVGSSPMGHTRGRHAPRTVWGMWRHPTVGHSCWTTGHVRRHMGVGSSHRGHTASTIAFWETEALRD